MLPRPEITRTNIHYRDALNLAYIVLDGVTASDLLKAGPIAGFSFMLNMPKLFEEFTSCLLESMATQHSVRVERQASDGSVLWNPDLNKSFGQVRPDVLLTSIDGRVQVPVDAKYKDYGNAKLNPSDVYQGANLCAHSRATLFAQPPAYMRSAASLCYGNGQPATRAGSRGGRRGCGGCRHRRSRGRSSRPAAVSRQRLACQPALALDHRPLACTDSPRCLTSRRAG